MKRSIFLSLVVASCLLLENRLYAQAATDPVGFNSITVGQNTTTALSLPFNKVPDFVAAATDVDTTAKTIQTTGAGWAANAFAPFFTNPHIVRIVSGAAIGRDFRIVSHTADTLTLDASSNMAGMLDTDRYQIFPSETLNSLFGPTAPGLNRNANPTQADNVLVRGTASWATNYNDPTDGWLDQSTGEPSGTVGITPDQGILLVRRGGGDYVFTDLGAVPITNLKTDFPQSKVTSFGNRFPVATTVNGLGLHLLAGWNKGPNPTIVDNLLVRGSSSWTTLYFDSTYDADGEWLDQSTGDPAGATSIPIGASVLVVRRAGSDITLDQARPYTLP